MMVSTPATTATNLRRLEELGYLGWHVGRGATRYFIKGSSAVKPSRSEVRDGVK